VALPALQAPRRSDVAPTPEDYVLVVDDDRGSLALMVATLGRLGFRAVCHTDAARALEAACARAPVVVVLDLVMPGVDGFGFLERFRMLPGCAAVPIIVWTMKDLSNRDLALLQDSVQIVVAKGPGAGSDLLMALHTFLSPKEARP
jgi:CheY-like chemotaxis protein